MKAPVGAREVALVCLCYLTYRLIQSFWVSVRFKRFARLNGCVDALNVGGTWPVSIFRGFLRLCDLFMTTRAGGDLFDDFLAKNFEQANTVERTQFEGTVVLFTNEPANLQAMLATQFKDFAIGQLRINQFFPVIGNSIFSSDGSFWEHSRALFRPQFNREQINDLESTEKATNSLCAAIGPTNSDGWTAETEMLPLFYNLTLDTASEFLFGESVHSQQFAIKDAVDLDDCSMKPGSLITRADAKQLAEDIRTGHDYMVLRIRLQRLYWLVDGVGFRRVTGRVKAFTERFIQKATNPAPTDESKERKYNLLSALATHTQDRIELRDQILSLLLAGRDSTADLLGWCTVRLALHPDIFAKLRTVVARDFPPSAPITFTKLKGCRYLQHFINEVHRLHPIIPINNRIALCDTTLPVGGGPDQRSPVAVPKGRMVAFSVYFLHRRKDLWGEDALEFRPERWEQRIPAWQYLPFGGGPRVCLGQQFSLTEISFVLVRLLQQFDAVCAVDEAQMRKMRKGIGLTMHPKDRVKVQFHKAGQWTQM